MKDYSFYVGSAYLLTVIVLAGLVLQSLWKSRAANSGKDDA